MDKIVHEQCRLKVLAALAADGDSIPFPKLRDELAMTGGNLSVQLKTLEDAGYVATRKYIHENKSRTDVSITEAGRKALSDYLDEMESLIASLRGRP
jgi:DNA-binding MarR family transcriptional regulator